MKSQKGFTLVEVLIATVILAVGVIGIFQALGRCMGAMRHVEQTFYRAMVLEEAAATIRPALMETAETDTSKDFHKAEKILDLPSGFTATLEPEKIEIEKIPFDYYRLKIQSPDESFQASVLFPSHEK